MKRFLLVIVACTPHPAPATVSVAASASAPAAAAAAASATASASPSVPALDLSTCGNTPGCKWTAGWQGRCSGVAVHAGDNLPPPTPVCVCNGCLADSDCTAKPNGKCETFPLMCRPNAMACTYPGDLCRDRGETACEKQTSTNGPPMHKACYHDGSGHVACSNFQWPPP